MTEITARRAAVRPRGYVDGKTTAEAHLLEDVVRDALRTHHAGLIEIIGGSGMGKTTALEHLAEVLSETELAYVSILDEPREDEIEAHSPGRVLICSKRWPRMKETILSVHLTGWAEDDAIEYLLAKHHDQCGSVMSRLGGSKENQIEYQLFVGCPELIAFVLDRMAQEESVTSVKQSVWDVLSEHIPAGELRELAGQSCLYSLLKIDNRLHKDWNKLQKNKIWKLHLKQNNQLPGKLLRHRYIQTLLAAEEFIREISNYNICQFVNPIEHPKLLFEAARLIESSSPAERNLSQMLSMQKSQELHPLAASLLHSTGRGWRPGRKPIPNLRGAILHGIQLAEEDLCEFDLTKAILCSANLMNAQLDGAVLVNANFDDANLSHASLVSANGELAQLHRANLKNVRGNDSWWFQADLSSADLEGAHFDNTRFSGATLSQANFTNASLRQSFFGNSQVDETNFTGADLTSADLQGLDLTHCELADACFGSAVLTGCHCEGINLLGANFENANLTNTYWTDSILPGANFQYAKLRSAGLAGIEWEQADLRGADLRQSTFHMGSSRSGLVDSFLASEGTRTGFYTDEYEEQHYKSPEEIRKANLRGADLRGANITGVDFYLVDLRDAEYDEDQKQQLEKTGAILFDRD